MVAFRDFIVSEFILLIFTEYSAEYYCIVCVSDFVKKSKLGKRV